MPLPSHINFEAALQRGLDALAKSADGGSTERFRKSGEHLAPVRTEPVEQLSMSLTEFVNACAPGQPALIDDMDVTPHLLTCCVREDADSTGEAG